MGVGLEDNLQAFDVQISNTRNSQCKVLVSTRSREASTNLNAKIYKMESLTDEESWRLFCVYAFPEYEENLAPEFLKGVPIDIVKECGNLPLAIKTTVASLAMTREISEWQSKLSKLKKVSNLTNPVMDILKLSYNSLPTHLKACFAYFSFFPKDDKIECKYLIYLWMGEGFIPTGEDPWNCLYQLANLSLVKVWEEDLQWYGLVDYCKIHDLLLNLAILISKENKCTFSLEDAFSGGDCWCRLFLAMKDIDNQAILQLRPVSPRLVRTLSLSCNAQISGNIPTMLFSGMRVLRVLDLSRTNVSTLPACVGEMKLLKILNLRDTKIKKVPKCLRSLKNLIYLNVSTHYVHLQAPKWISELKCLRHLEGQFYQMPKGISKLKSLRTLRLHYSYLRWSSGEYESVLTMEDVGKMRELWEISFFVENGSQLKKMEKGILAPLTKMRRLRVYNSILGTSASDLPQFSESMDLEHLSLSHFAVPSWICCLTNLRYLLLRDCHCSEYPELQEMPNLVSLVLWGNERRREIPKALGKKGRFPRLRFFRIWDFKELEEFPEMEDGAMPCLELLKIRGCKKLNQVGEGLQRLKRLEKIHFQ